MKKLMMMALMSLAVSTAFAQDVSKQISAAKSYDEAMARQRKPLPLSQ